MTLVRIRPSAILAFVLLGGVAALGSAHFLSLGPLGAALIGLAVSSLHWAALFVHHFGHAVAARTTGFPMVGIGLWWWLATSRYPRDEPPLPRRVHLRRAIGGPIASVLFGVLVGLLVANFGADWRNPLAAVGWFASLDSLLVFGIGSLIPLGFNDGSTLIRWWSTPGDRRDG